MNRTARTLHLVNLRVQVGQGSRDQSTVGIATRASTNGVRLPRACLAISKHRPVEASHAVIDNTTSYVLEHFLLRCVRQEDLLERERSTDCGSCIAGGSWSSFSLQWLAQLGSVGSYDGDVLPFLVDLHSLCAGLAWLETGERLNVSHPMVVTQRSAESSLLCSTSLVAWCETTCPETCLSALAWQGRHRQASNVLVPRSGEYRSEAASRETSRQPVASTRAIEWQLH